MKEIFLKHINELEQEQYRLEIWDESRTHIILGFSIPQTDELVRFRIYYLDDIIIKVTIKEDLFSFTKQFIDSRLKILREICENHPFFRLKLLTGIVHIETRVCFDQVIT